MRRFRFVLSASLVVALVASLFFVAGSYAEPLGTGLLQHFGVRSGGENAGTQAITRRYDLPVEVANTDENPVPVTVQGSSSQPLTATIDGTVDTLATIQGAVDTRDVNDPSAQPFQTQLTLTPPSGTGGEANQSFAVLSGKRLIIRYVSATFDTLPDAYTGIAMTTTVGGITVEHRLPESSAGVGPSIAHHWYGLDTWITAGSGTDVLLNASYSGTSPLGSAVADIAISGYLVDASTVPTP